MRVRVRVRVWVRGRAWARVRVRVRATVWDRVRYVVMNGWSATYVLRGQVGGSRCRNGV